MTTRIHTRPTTVPPYYLGRPAAFWLAVSSPRPAARTSPRASCAGDSALLAPEQPIR